MFQDREGTNYITTGAGMALSAAALQRLMSCSSCHCRVPDAPDDMSLGSWFRSLGIQPPLGVSQCGIFAAVDAFRPSFVGKGGQTADVL